MSSKSRARQAKRTRKTRLIDDSYEDSISTGDDFGIVEHQESGQDIGGRYFLHPSVQHHSTWDVGDEWAEDDSEFALDDSGTAYLAELDDNGYTHHTVPDSSKKRKQTRNPRSKVSVRSYDVSFRLNFSLYFFLQRRVHKVWTEKYRSQYLDELIRHEGRADFRHETECYDCKQQNIEEELRGKSLYRCKDCYTPDLVCASCCVKRHSQDPFHCIEVRLLRTLTSYIAN